MKLTIDKVIKLANDKPIRSDTHAGVSDRNGTEEGINHRRYRWHRSSHSKATGKIGRRCSRTWQASTLRDTLHTSNLTLSCLLMLNTDTAHSPCGLFLPQRCSIFAAGVRIRLRLQLRKLPEQEATDAMCMLMLQTCQVWIRPKTWRIMCRGTIQILTFC